MDDLKERLRGTYSTGPFGSRSFSPFIPLIQIEAAARIEALEAQLAARRGSIVISVEWLEAVLAYANPIGVMGDHVFAEIRAMIATATAEREGV